MLDIFEYPGKALDTFFVVSEHIRSTAIIQGFLSRTPKLESALTIHIDVVKFSNLNRSGLSPLSFGVCHGIIGRCGRSCGAIGRRLLLRVSD